ncbi:MAG TPA: hypothetical protein VMU08_17010 [Rhizomicrobium sp.]|nr:hypothetical protein [Rhizomicrobium sp.]
MNIARAIVIAALAAAPCAAHADARQDLIDGMAKCAAIGDGTARLACYDALNPTLKAAQSTPPPAAEAPAAAAAPPGGDSRPWYDPGRIFGVSPREQTTPEQFGGENLAPPPPPPGTPQTAANTPPPALDSITATVTDYSFNPYNKFVVFLDNGQIWKQLESDTGLKARFQKDGKNVVVISRGFVGSYNMTINDGPAYKVARVK